MSRVPSLQDPFLNALRKEKIPLFIFLVNGIKLKGMIEAFDQFSIILRNSDDHINQMIYKHAISTIAPTKAVRFMYSNYNPNHHAQHGHSEQEHKTETDHQALTDHQATTDDQVFAESQASEIPLSQPPEQAQP